MKKYLFVFLTVLSVIGLLGCQRQAGTAAEGGRQGEFEIILAGGHPPTSSLTINWNNSFIPRVQELSNGRIRVQHFENDQLGVEVNRTEQVQLGVVHMTYVSEAAASINPRMSIFPLPFLFRDEAHFDAVIDGPVGQRIVEDFPRFGLRPLGFFENGFRVITNSRRPINNLSDMAGLRIRVPQSEVPIALFNALGANTVAMSFGEVYSALQTGTVDGQENAFNSIASSRLFEVQSHFAETNHQMGTFVIVASETWWNTLPADIQEIIQTAARETSIYQRRLHREQFAIDRQILIDNGMQATRPDPAEFIRATERVYEDLFTRNPDFRPIVNDIRALR